MNNDVSSNSYNADDEHNTSVGSLSALLPSDATTPNTTTPVLTVPFHDSDDESNNNNNNSNSYKTETLSSQENSNTQSFTDLTIISDNDRTSDNSNNNNNSSSSSSNGNNGVRQTRRRASSEKRKSLLERLAVYKSIRQQTEIEMLEKGAQQQQQEEARQCVSEQQELDSTQLGSEDDLPAKSHRVFQCMRSIPIHPIFSIRVILVLLVMVLVGAGCFSSGITQYMFDKQGTQQLSREIKDYIGTNLNQHTLALLNEAEIIARIQNGTHFEINNSTTVSNLEQLFRYIKGSQNLGSISFGDTRGNIIGVNAIIKYQQVLYNITDDYNFYVKYAEDPESTLYFCSDLYNGTLGPITSTNKNFTLDTRNWFQLGLRSTDASFKWSEVYFNALNILTISLALPFFARNESEVYPSTVPGANPRVTGVMGLHLYLPKLSTFLSRLDVVGRDGKIVILDSRGLIVQDSDDIASQAIFNSPIPPPVGALSNVVPRLTPFSNTTGLYKSIDTAIKQHYGTYDNISYDQTLTIDGYWVSFQKVMDANLDWTIVVITNSGNFLSHIYLATKYTLITSISVLVAATFVAIFMTVVITRPMGSIVRRMEKISQMEFEKGQKESKCVLTGTSAFYEIAALQRSMEKMQRALMSFEKFVPTSVVKEILNTDSEASLGVDSKRVTVFFSDIEDFTRISETLNPPIRLVNLLSEYLQAVSQIILSETEGTIDKFIGDAVMAFWNAPKPVMSHAVLACDAALLCQRKLEHELRPKWVSEGLPPLRCRIGIHTGDVLVGNIGSLSRMNYTVIGDNVNIASRLESLCKRYGVNIIISATTYESVKEKYLCRYLDRVVVKGKTRPLVIYELVEEHARATEEQRHLCAQQERAMELFFGPEQDFERARELFAELQERFPQDKPIAIILQRLQRLCESQELRESWPGFEPLYEK